MRHLLTLPALLLLMLIAGCTPWATYPPIEGAVDISNPTLKPIPDLMAGAIRRAYERDGASGEIIFNLPADTPPDVYDKVMAKLATSRPMREVGERAYHIAAVRVRAMEAEVDLIHLGEGDVPELLTISFSQHLLHGWRVKTVRPWRIRVEAPGPNYVPPPVEPEDLPAEEPAEPVEAAEPQTPPEP